MDAVSNYFHGQGLRPVRQRFLETDIALGQTIVTDHFTLTYRLEGQRLLLCDFTARADEAGRGDGQAVLALLALLRRTMHAVPALRQIDGLILPAPRDPELDRMRRRLADSMRAAGARPVDIDGAMWLRYSCH